MNAELKGMKPTGPVLQWSLSLRVGKKAAGGSAALGTAVSCEVGGHKEIGVEGICVGRAILGGRLYCSRRVL